MVEGLNLAKVDDLLSNVNNIAKKYDDDAQKTGSIFNIFKILNISTKETAICRVMVDLLSPNGSHRQGGDFLRLFLQKCLGVSDFTDNDIQDSYVLRECQTDDGRPIDISISVGKHFLPIEVKINANDQPAQCYDYFEDSKYKGADKLYYLTKFGTPPSIKSVMSVCGKYELPKSRHSNGDKYRDVVQISFSEHIVSWLEECLTLQSMSKKAPISAIILQLITVIKQFSYLSEDEMMNEVIELISQSRQNIDNARIISEALEASKEIAAKRFYDKFKEGFTIDLEQIESKIPIYVFEKNAIDDVSVVFGLDYGPNYPLFIRLGMVKNMENTYYRDIGVATKLREKYKHTENQKYDWGICYNTLTFNNIKRLNFNNYNQLPIFFDDEKLDSLVGNAIEQAKDLLSEYKERFLLHNRA